MHSGNQFRGDVLQRQSGTKIPTCICSIREIPGNERFKGLPKRDRYDETEKLEVWAQAHTHTDNVTAVRVVSDAHQVETTGLVRVPRRTGLRPTRRLNLDGSKDVRK